MEDGNMFSDLFPHKYGCFFDALRSEEPEDKIKILGTYEFCLNEVWVEKRAESEEESFNCRCYFPSTGISTPVNKTIKFIAVAYKRTNAERKNWIELKVFLKEPGSNCSYDEWKLGHRNAIASLLSYENIDFTKGPGTEQDIKRAISFLMKEIRAGKFRFSKTATGNYKFRPINKIPMGKMFPRERVNCTIGTAATLGRCFM